MTCITGLGLDASSEGCACSLKAGSEEMNLDKQTIKELILYTKNLQVQLKNKRKKKGRRSSIQLKNIKRILKKRPGKIQEDPDKGWYWSQNLKTPVERHEVQDIFFANRQIFSLYHQSP